MAFDPERAELFGPWTVTAGARGVELVLVRHARRGRVAGRIVSMGGTPLAGVELNPHRRVPGADNHGQVPILRPWHITSDAEGRFEFPELVLDDLTLQIQHPDLGVRSEELARHGDLEQLELALPILCELQVQLATGATAAGDSFAVLDAAGDALELQEVFSGGWSLVRSVALVDGLSPVTRVPETAATLVLYEGGAEVLRRSLKLVPGELTLVSP
jgi:hypothetical protein